MPSFTIFDLCNQREGRAEERGRGGAEGKEGLNFLVEGDKS